MRIRGEYGMEKNRIRDPVWKKLESGINIPDPQHWLNCWQSVPFLRPTPGSGDWYCPKCNNMNYARRTQCNRQGCDFEKKDLDDYGSRLDSTYKFISLWRRALSQSLLHAPRGHDGVLHRLDQTRFKWHIPITISSLGWEWAAGWAWWEWEAVWWEWAAAAVPEWAAVSGRRRVPGTGTAPGATTSTSPQGQ